LQASIYERISLCGSRSRAWVHPVIGPARRGRVKLPAKRAASRGLRRIGYDFGRFFNLARFGSSAGHDTM
jgi:hypothetical protein